MWVSQPKEEWVHDFLHTLDEMQRQWYISTELHGDITTWEELSVCFSHTFSFVDVDRVIHSVLQYIPDVVLKVVPVSYPGDPHEVPMMQSMMECYNVTGGPDDGDDPWNIIIPEREGNQNVTTPKKSRIK